MHDNGADQTFATACRLICDFIVHIIARFVSDLVGNPEDRFSRGEAHMKGRNQLQRTYGNNT